jgi:hypothetical protein
MSEEAMSGSATTLSPRASRWILVAAPVLALLGSVAAPAQAGDFYGPDRYDYGPSRYGYGPSRYDYDPYRYHHGCSSCGCWRCGYQSSVRRGSVFERRYRYVEREYVERRYTWPVHRSSYGYGYGWHRSPSYGYGWHRSPSYGWHRSYPGYRTWSTPSFPWGYGGVRGQQSSYGYGPSSYYEEPPRPPAPVGYDAEPYGDEGRRWDPE